MKHILKKLLYSIPHVKRLQRELKLYKTEFPPGHYYSPITSKEDLLRNQETIFGKRPIEIKGVNFNEKQQFDLLNTLQVYYNEIPFGETKKENLRYYLNNPFYYYSDGIMLYSMMRYFKPKRIIEVGSGFSSALMLDVNDIFFKSTIHFDFIDPYPERLYSLLKEVDKRHHNIIIKEVQKVDIEIFNKLDENDILFIDSSHVSKIGSDVNFLLFEVLPTLKSGTLIHFHDIFDTFEYPKDWAINKHWSWNENYILRAFLQYNQVFKIIMFNTYLENRYKDWFVKNMPLCIKKEHSVHGSIWLRKS